MSSTATHPALSRGSPQLCQVGNALVDGGGARGRTGAEGNSVVMMSGRSTAVFPWAGLDRVARARPGRGAFHFARGFALRRSRRRTPGPPPFSSMNTTPAVSSALRIASSLAAVSGVCASASSARRIVFTPKAVARARSAALQRSKARPALICAPESENRQGDTSAKWA
jgi:hypothetical protein